MSTVSIAIPAYNYGRYLPCAIDSVLRQDFADVEVIVVDDCSTDDTPQRVEPYLADPRFRYVRNERNLGAVRNINKAVAEARGDFILLLGADDFLLPGSLSALIKALQKHPEAGFAYGNYVAADENDEIIEVGRHPGHIPANLPPWRDDFPELLYFDHYINLGTALFRREVIDKFGFFDPLLSIDEFPGRFFRATDWDLCLRLSLHGIRSTFIYSPLSAFRIHSTQASIGGEFDSEGIGLQEFLVLLDRYLVDSNARRLAGHEKGIAQQLQSKKTQFLKVADSRGMACLPSLEYRIRRAEDFLRQLRNTLFDEALPERPRLSIVLLASDNPQDLLPTLSDLDNQCHVDQQVLVINRGHMDLSHLCGAHRHLQLPGSLPGEARRYGAQLTDGEAICFIEAGSRLPPMHLGSIAAALKQAGCLVVQSAWERLPEPMPSGSLASWPMALAGLLPPGHVWRTEVPPLSAFAMRRHVYYRSDGFDPALPILDDLDFLLRLQRLVPIHSIPEKIRSHSIPSSMLKEAQDSFQPDLIARSLQTIASRQPAS